MILSSISRPIGVLLFVGLLGGCGGSSASDPPAGPPVARSPSTGPGSAPSTDGSAEPRAPDQVAGSPEVSESGTRRVEDVSGPVARVDGPSDPEAWAEAVLADLTLREKVGQMIMSWVLGDFAPEGSESFDRVARLIDEEGVGGVIISVGTPLDVATKLNVLQRRSRVPLLVAADLETGAGFRLRGAVHLPGGTELGGATDFPALMALGAANDRLLAYEMGRITAEEARAVGIHVPFAPVLDVNSNPDNPIINTRSFGEDPALVGALGSCLIRGIQDYGAIATGKHFPGHGDTGIDSHLELPVLRLGLDRLERIELKPFRDAVDSGMKAIMTAHIALPAISEDPRLPATLSRNILTGLLRDQMGFEGLVFTDAMDMGAIDRLFGRDEAAVRAVEAGADVLLMPPDPAAAIDGVISAVLQGRISEGRIDASVRRILRAKAEVGLHRERTVDLEAVHRTVGVDAHLEVAEEIARRSLTLLRNERDLVPLAGTRSADVLSITYRRSNDLLAGRTFDRRLRDIYPRLATVAIGSETMAEEYDRLTRRAQSVDLVVLSLHISAVSYRGSVGGPTELMDFIRGISRSGRPNIVVSFGNPYLLNEFPEVQAYLLAWSGAGVSQRAAADALTGSVDVLGRTPTRIPPDFAIGDGIQVRAVRSVVEPAAGACGCAAGSPSRVEACP